MDEKTTRGLFPNTYEILRRYGDAIVANYRKVLKDEGINASMHLNDNIKAVIKNDDTEYELTIHMPFYARFIEEGTGEQHIPDARPNYRPPVDALTTWLKFKQVIKHPDKRGNLPSDTQLAWMISRRIAGDLRDRDGNPLPGGTAPKKVYEKALATTDPVVWKSRLQEAVDADIKTNLMEIIRALNSRKL